MRQLATTLFVSFVGLSTAAYAEDLSISFDWSGLKPCTSGRPNTVNNPEFVVKGLPEGAAGIQFQLKDLDVPGFKHGGGWIDMTADGRAPAGAFRYKSPCPPDGVHTYEWTATAKTKKGIGGKALGVAKAQRDYPE